MEKKTVFFIKIIFQPFFQNFACRAVDLARAGSLECFGRARKINFVEQNKKTIDNIFEIFLKSASPHENFLNPPLSIKDKSGHLYQMSKSVPASSFKR